MFSGNQVLKELLSETSLMISRTSEPLLQIVAESEPVFLDVGRKLQTLYIEADDLSLLMKNTAGLIDSRSDQGVLGNMGNFSRQALSRIDSCNEEIAAVLPNMESCAMHLKRLQDLCPVIRQIAKKLNIVALHISMESSRTKKSEDMFSFFVKEIKQLAAKVHHISALMQNNSEKAGNQQLNDLAGISARRNSLFDLSNDARRMVEENVGMIDGLMDMSLNVLHRSEDHSKKISLFAGEIVEALQFHDICRQQIEHVTQNLKDVEIFLSDTAGEDQTNEYSNTDIARIYSIIKVQSGQIGQVIDEINRAYMRIKGSFSSVGNEIDTLVDDVDRLGFGRDKTAGASNSFHSLITGLTNLEGFMARGKEMTKAIETNLHRSAESASALADHLRQMEDIGMELHIKAINALL